MKHKNINIIEKPWGYEELLLSENGYGFKKIVINRKKFSSYHMHDEKSEIFYILKGSAKIRFENSEKFLKKNEFIFIPKATLHQIINNSPLKILEILEFGYPYESADVIRIEDPWAAKRTEDDKLQTTSYKPQTNSKIAVFLDRDGVINAERKDYVKNWNEFTFLPKVKSAIRRLNSIGFPVIVVTNQSCISRGIITEAELGKIHEFMKKELSLAGAKIDALYYCPHTKDSNCNCRKPKTGLVEKAAMDFNLNLKNCWIIGDSMKFDIQMGKAAGMKTILVESGTENNLAEFQEQPDYIVSNLNAAVELIKDKTLPVPKPQLKRIFKDAIES